MTDSGVSYLVITQCYAKVCDIKGLYYVVGKLQQRITHCLCVRTHSWKAWLCGRFSLHSSCCWVTERDTSGVWKRSSFSLTPVSRCSLNSAPLLASLFHLTAKLSLRLSLTCPLSCCVCAFILDIPLHPPPPLLRPHFPSLHNCQN